LILKHRLIYKMESQIYTESILYEGVMTVFDMLKVGRNISKLRKKIGITQMDLADRLHISYQAVSNWERGETMPDISKLPQIAEIFDVSIDEILDEGKSTEILKNMLDNTTNDYLQHNEVSLKEISEIAPLLKTEQVDEFVANAKDSVEIGDLLSIAPFVSEETIDRFAKQVFEKEGIYVLVALAPFMSSEAIDECAKKAFEKEGINSLVSIAPFMSSEAIDECAKRAFEKEGLRALVSIAPFISRGVMNDCTESSAIAKN
jgi:transcriptional regulator with XRE-family HTH domain